VVLLIVEIKVVKSRASSRSGGVIAMLLGSIMLYDSRRHRHPSLVFVIRPHRGHHRGLVFFAGPFGQRALYRPSVTGSSPWSAASADPDRAPA